MDKLRIVLLTRTGRPSGEEILKKLVSAQKSSDASDTRSSKLSKKEEKKKREEIQRLLEESGAESSRIMKYLFEEKEGESDSDTPW